MGWLNDNAGAIQALTALLLVVVTSAYVALTYFLVQQARRSRRPYVYIELTSAGPGGTLYLHVGNSGDVAARRVRFTGLASSVKDVADAGGPRHLSEIGPFVRGIDHIPPGRSMRFLLVVDEEVLRERGYGVRTLSVDFTYEAEGRVFEDDYSVDFATLTDLLHSTFREPGDNVAEVLKPIAASVERIARG